MALLTLTAFIAVGCGGGQSADSPPASGGSQTEAGSSEKLKVGFVYMATPGDGGWTYSHDQGRKYLEETLPDVEVMVVENVPDVTADAERIMEQMIKNGVKVIFGTTFGYMDAIMNVSKKYPDVYFLHCTGYQTADNVSIYDVREYDATYLTGVVAGMMTKTNKIGYVAAQPIPVVVRAINSFALGVKSVNPDAKVRVVWTSTWYDPAKEKEAALGLLDTGVDVVAQYQDTPAVQQAAEERGAYSIGFHSDMRKFAPNANLTSYMWNWGPFYVEQVEAYQNGTWKSIDAWLSMAEGACDIAPLNEDLVPADVIQHVDEVKNKIIAGEIKVFEGPIWDNQGNQMAQEGEVLPDDVLRSMNWLVDNIDGQIPN